MSEPGENEAFIESEANTIHEEALPIPQLVLNMFGPTYRPTQAITLYPSQPVGHTNLENVMARYESELLSLPPPTFGSADAKKKWFQNLTQQSTLHSRPHVTSLAFAGGDDRRHRAFTLKTTPTVATETDISSLIISNPCLTPIHFPTDRVYKDILTRLYPESLLTQSATTRTYLRSLFPTASSPHSRAPASPTSTQLALTLAGLLARYNPHHALSSLAARHPLAATDSSTLVLAELEALVGSLTQTQKLRNPSLASWTHPDANASIPSSQPVVVPAFLPEEDQGFMLFLDMPQLTVLNISGKTQSHSENTDSGKSTENSLISLPRKRKIASCDSFALSDVLALATTAAPTGYRGGAAEYILHKRYRSGPTARGNGWVTWQPVRLLAQTTGSSEENDGAAIAAGVSVVPSPDMRMPQPPTTWNPARFLPIPQAQAKNMSVCDLSKMMASMRDFAVKDIAKGATIKGFFGEPKPLPEKADGSAAEVDVSWLQRSERAVVPCVDITRFVRAQTENKGVHVIMCVASACVLDGEVEGKDAQEGAQIVPSLSGRPGLMFIPEISVSEAEVTLKSQAWQRLQAEQQELIRKKTLEGIPNAAESVPSVSESALDAATNQVLRERTALLCALDSMLASDGECAWTLETLRSISTADAGVAAVPVYWESRNAGLLSQLIAGVRGLRQGGTLITTVAETCTPFTISAVYVCYRLFCEVHIVTTRSGAGTYTGERTIVCRGLRQARPKWVEEPLMRLQREFEKSGKCISGTWLVDPALITRDSSFMELMSRQSKFRCELDSYWLHTIARGHLAEQQETHISQLLSQISAEKAELRAEEEERLMQEGLDSGASDEEVMLRVEEALAEMVAAERGERAECVGYVRHQKGLMILPTIPVPLMGAKISEVAARAWLHWREKE